MKIKATASIVAHDLVERKSGGSPAASAAKKIVYNPGARYALPAWATLLLSCSSLSVAAESEASKDFKIEGQPLAAALNEFARQSDRQILFSTDVVDAKHSSGIAGKLTPEAALQQLLKGTGLTFRFTTHEIILIDKPKQSATANFPALLEMRLAQVTNASETSSLNTDSNAQSAHAAAAAQPLEKLEEIIVTGVLAGLDKQQSAIAISTLDAAELKTIVPTSSLDLLKNVPGVYVDSSAGEIRNNITVRGLGSIGIEEDGLPVSGDFLRADSSLERVEAVRGGSAAVAGSNAPGGVFNYIGKTGGEETATEVSLLYGLQGNGELPQYRADFSVGGPLALGSGWFYHVGGFYRRDDGSHDAGYAMNKGGQLKGNVVKKFDNGSLQMYFKILDDHNGYNDSVPAVDFDSPHAAPGFDNTSSVLIPAVRFSFQTGPNSFKTYDSTDLFHAQEQTLGVKYEGDFGSGWSLSNNARYSHTEVNQNTTSRPYVWPFQGPTAFYSYYFLGTFGIPGTYTMTDRLTGTSAQVLSNTGFDFTVLNNNLPGQNVLSDVALNQSANALRQETDQLQNRFAVTKRFDRMAFTGGAYFNRARTRNRNEIQGFGFSTFTPQPRMLDITLLTPAGQTLQVTNPQGFAAPNNVANVGSNNTTTEMALFFGHRWEFVDRWTLDWGVRRSRADGDADNQSNAGAINVTSTTGGLDGNPNTLYDNQYVIPGANVHAERTLNTTSYSGAINFEINENNATYLRYSLGKRVDMGFIGGLTNPATKDTTPWIPQTTEQWELGYKFREFNYSFSATGYYGLQKTRSAALLSSATNSLYYEFGPESEISNYGIEAEGEYRFDFGFGLRAALTWQKGEVLHNYVLTQPNGPGTVTVTDANKGNKVAYLPNAMATITPSYGIGRFYGQLQWKYMGDRAANNANAFTLPAFDQTDLTLQWAFTDKLDLSFTVNNVFDDEGVMQWGAPGDAVSTLNLEAFTRSTRYADPDAVFIYLPIQARAYFLKATYRF